MLPAVVLIDPKYDYNVGNIIRTCSCYGVKTLIWSGERVQVDKSRSYRLPREERMAGYRDVHLFREDMPLDMLKGGVPVAVEVRAAATPLPIFVHPKNAMYVFGPEDGSLGRPTLNKCHLFVTIPTRHCLNLSTAVATVLYDRMMKEAVNATGTA
jgi:tRNA(Leu) C34 or U34 (ribose-2'-O)-methylase TrmL